MLALSKTIQKHFNLATSAETQNDPQCQPKVGGFGDEVFIQFGGFDIWRFVKMSVPGFVDKSQFHACRLMFAFKKHDLPWWRENVEILRYLWKSF